MITTFNLIGWICFTVVDKLQTQSLYNDNLIISQTLECVEQVNYFGLSLNPNEEEQYNSSNTPCRSDEKSVAHGEWFTYEFFNDLNVLILNFHYNWKEGIFLFVFFSMTINN